MLHTLTDPQAQLIRVHLETLVARTASLVVSYPENSLCTRLSVDSKALLDLFSTLMTDQQEPAQADDLVDVIYELQGRLPKGAAVTIQIPPLKYDR